MRENIKIVVEGKIEEGNVVKKYSLPAFFDYFDRLLSNPCVLDSFCFKRYLLSDFIASNY